MFCPNCGKKNSTEQKFCRACGLNLEKTAVSLLEQLPVTARSTPLSDFENSAEKFQLIILLALCAVGFVGIGALIYNILAKMILSGTNVIGGVIVLSFLILAVLSLIAIYLPKAFAKTDTKKIEIEPRGNEFDKPVVIAELLSEGNFEPIPVQSNVTENTTDFLYSGHEKTKKFE